MSDIEEPPSKLTKFQLESQYMEGDVTDEGQEEWLSEGILTDDDFNPALDPDRTNSNLGSSQDDTLPSTNDGSMEHLDQFDHLHQTVNQMQELGALDPIHAEENIEETLNSLENSHNNNNYNNQTEFPEELNAFLVRKTDNTASQQHVGEGGEAGERKDEGPPGGKDEGPTGGKGDEGEEMDSDMTRSDNSDDGNDTDDLLRMLGEGGDKRNKTVQEVPDADYSDDDDDEFIFEGAKMKTLAVAKNALVRKYPAARAEPEEDDDLTDASSDEGDNMEKIFGVQKPNTQPKSGPASEKPNTFTLKPGTVTLRPSTVTLRPSTVTLKPSAVTLIPGTVTSRPSMITSNLNTRSSLRSIRPKFKTVSAQPNTTAAKLSPVSPKPSPVSPKPSTVTLKPRTVTSKPSTVTSKPSTVTSKPSTVTSKPSTVTSKPITVTSKPSRVRSKPTTVLSKPNTPSTRPSTPSTKPSTPSSKPSTPSSNASAVSAKISNYTEKRIENPKGQSAEQTNKGVTTKMIKVVEKAATPRRQSLRSQVNKSAPPKAQANVKRTPSDVTEDMDALPESIDNPLQGAERSGEERERQRIMRPECMDEDIPTDGESETDEESLYDELPSSDSENMEEWFTLDIRAERAGDYLPLLADKAHQLLTHEKERVKARLTDLKKSLSALTDNSKLQADRLRQATVTLAELDTLLKAT